MSQIGLDLGWVSERFPSKHATQAGWLAANVNCLLFLLDFPGSLDARATGLPGVPPPALSHAPLTLSEFFTGESQLFPPPVHWLAGWLLCVMEGERWKNQAASGGFVGKGKKNFFFLSTHLRFSGWRQIDKRRIGNSLVVQWLGLYTFTAEGVGSIPTLGTKIPQAMQCSQITIIIVK